MACMVTTDLTPICCHLVHLCSWPEHVQPTALCHGHTLYPCGPVGPGGFGELVEKVHSIVAKLEHKAKDGAKGFQRTPAFIHACASAALSGGGAEAVKMPRGGFTDVGQHTGGIPRSTAWALVREMLQVRACKRTGGACFSMKCFQCFAGLLMRPHA